MTNPRTILFLLAALSPTALAAPGLIHDIETFFEAAWGEFARDGANEYAPWFYSEPDCSVGIFSLDKQSSKASGPFFTKFELDKCYEVPLFPGGSSGARITPPTAVSIVNEFPEGDLSVCYVQQNCQGTVDAKKGTLDLTACNGASVLQGSSFLELRGGLVDNDRRSCYDFVGEPQGMMCIVCTQKQPVDEYFNANNPA